MCKELPKSAQIFKIVNNCSIPHADLENAGEFLEYIDKKIIRVPKKYLRATNVNVDKHFQNIDFNMFFYPY